jgi:hypothetical protein
MTNKAPRVPKLKLPRPPTPDYKSDRIYHNNRFIDSETYMMEIKDRPVEQPETVKKEDKHQPPVTIEDFEKEHE